MARRRRNQARAMTDVNVTSLVDVTVPDRAAGTWNFIVRPPNASIRINHLKMETILPNSSLAVKFRLKIRVFQVVSS